MEAGAPLSPRFSSLSCDLCTLTEIPISAQLPSVNRGRGFKAPGQIRSFEHINQRKSLSPSSNKWFQTTLSFHRQLIVTIDTRYIFQRKEGFQSKCWVNIACVDEYTLHCIIPLTFQHHPPHTLWPHPASCITWQCHVIQHNFEMKVILDVSVRCQ